MNILILKPGNYKLDFTFYAGALGYPILQGTCLEKDRRLFREILETILAKCRECNDQQAPDAIAVFGNHGGEDFKKPEIVCEDTFKKLSDLIPFAPLEIPGIKAVMEGLTELAPDTSQVPSKVPV